MDPNLIELRHADHLTVGTIGEPGQRTFFLQAAQDDLVISLVIEKEQATAIAIAISNVLADHEAAETVDQHERMDLIHPVRPLFRVGKLSMGHDEQREMIVIIAEALAPEGETARRVRIWGTRSQMLALAHQAVLAVAAGRPICPLCHEVLDPGAEHVCVRGNGRKRVG
jgi:uncharacterized repeat protein (TIGR03847 family)